MKIRELKLQNFKRFTDLTLTKIPDNAKLVLLIGANGSGKSSIFDAFSALVRDTPHAYNVGRIDYFIKNDSKKIDIGVTFVGGQTFRKNNLYSSTGLPAHAFYGRPSLRIVSQLNANMKLDESVIRNNTDVPDFFIDADDKFNLDVLKYTQDINRALREPVFRGEQADTLQIFRSFIEPINNALKRIFDLEDAISLRIVQFEESAPNNPPKLIFEKGTSRINYDLLSHGEKQVVIILLNFVVRSEYFTDTVYYIDEMDVHLNTSLQYALLKEITENWIPENCQLWTATHALGFIEYAKDADHAAIIDLDNLDFDEEQIIEPSPKYQDDVFEVAIPRKSLAKILGNRKVVLCENKNYELYSKMGLDDFIFTDVQNAGAVFTKIKRDTTILGLRDRDFLTDNEILKLKEKFPHYKILAYYCFENYLYHPDNVAELGLADFDVTTYKNEILAAKNNIKNVLIQKVGQSRSSYDEFRGGGIAKDNDSGQITEALFSDDFEVFYPFLSMKEYCGGLIHLYKIDKKEAKEKLVQTVWFKNQLNAILSSK